MTVLRRAAVTCLVYASVALCSAGMFPLVKVRAVEAPSVCSDLADAEAQIQLYLSSSSSSSAASGVFHVQGWRWHTMSLVLEARRLHQLAVRVLEQQQQQDDLSDLTALQTVADYTVNFNLRGLHRIEKDLFFPWVRTKTKTIREKDVVRAFDDVLDQLERDRQRIETLGALLMERVTIAADASVPWDVRSRAVGDVAFEAAAIADSAHSMLKREEATVVPVVAWLVSESEQKSFNNQVIRKLGLFDSRLHLVGMHEAVVDNEAERRLFQETIPSIPQRMIPRWKRLLYEPRAGALDKIRSQ